MLLEIKEDSLPSKDREEAEGGPHAHGLQTATHKQQVDTGLLGSSMLEEWGK